MTKVSHEIPSKRYKKPADFEPEEAWAEGKRKGQPRCLGWSTTAGRQCKKEPEPGRQYCRFHNGRRPVGEASHLYKNGKHSRYAAAIAAQQRLSKYYQEALSSDTILSLAPEIALTEAQLKELYEDRAAFTNEISSKTKAVSAAFIDMEMADEEGNQIAAQKNMAKLGLLINELLSFIEDGKAADDREMSLMERKRRLTETEFRRMQADDQTILLTHAMAALAALTSDVVEIIRERIPVNQSVKIISDVKARAGRYIGPVADSNPDA